MNRTDRRVFLKLAAGVAAGAGRSSFNAGSAAAARKPLFTISLAQWSLHRALFGKQLDNLDFARVAKQEYGIDAVEYVNQFFKTKAKDRGYLAEMKKRAADYGVQNVLIMCDGEGALGDPDAAKRKQAIENHYQWVEAAKFLGCHSIRVNAQSNGTYEEQIDRAADGLRRLTEFGAAHAINVIVENHGKLSSNGDWLTTVIKKVGHPRCGTLPDFGNFNLGDGREYDRYRGVEQMMPFAKGVSAKTHDFTANGSEAHTDYWKMMKIVLAAGYHGRVGIEYEGNSVSEPEGIRKSKALLEMVRSELEAFA